jgi:hypothetical protein
VDAVYLDGFFAGMVLLGLAPGFLLGLVFEVLR